MFPRKPKIENKYGLTKKSLDRLAVKDRSKVKEPFFWRNNVINAWCVSRGSGRGIYGPEDGFWLGIYDSPYKGKFIRCWFTAHEDMCSYDFSTFYDFSEIESKADLEIQEKALEVLNYLLDEGIIAVEV